MQRREILAAGETWTVYDVRATDRHEPTVTSGWLCFESTTVIARRRFFGIPPQWEQMTPDQLSALWRDATPALLPPESR
jgi:hypothetical protein